MPASKEQLIQVREQYAEAHDLLVLGTFPGGAFKTLPRAIAFMTANVADITEKIKAIEATEKPPEVAPVPDLPAPETKPNV